MLTVEMTPSYLGFRISGSYDDLDRLYDAIYELTVDSYPDKGRPKATAAQVSLSTRLLALNYELRHAYQGDRGVNLLPDALDEGRAYWHGVSAPKHQVIYSTEILYPEVMFYLVALEYLMQLRKSWLAGRKTYSPEAFNQPIQLFDGVICQARLFQSLVLEALKPHLSKQSFAKLGSVVLGGRDTIASMALQWLDQIDVNFCKLGPEKRKKSLVSTVVSIAGYFECVDYCNLISDLDSFAKQHGCLRDAIDLNIDWPEDYDWGYLPNPFEDEPAPGGYDNVIHVDFGSSEEAQRQANSKVIEAFASHLRACGLSDKTVGNHVDNIEFFLNDYVVSREGESIANSHECIIDFMGYFFICKCMWASPSSIDGYCASFKKFYSFAEREGLVGPGVAA